MRVSRRRFVQSAAAGGAAALLSTGASAAETTHPASHPSTTKNSRPGIAVIGCGGMGRFHGQFLGKYGDLVAVCDVDRDRRAAYNKDFGAGKAFETGDHRELLSRRDLDAVFVCTPDHWHTHIAADVLRSGRDLYCEKPLTLTIDEGRYLCRVARQSARVFQVGTQQRSDERFQTAIALAQLGRLGKIRKVTVVIGDTPQGANFKPTAPPPNLDWDRWLGQAPKVDYIPERCHYNFRWWYEYSGGRMTDWGAHHVDIAQSAVAPDLPGPMWIEPVQDHLPVPFEHGQPTVDNAYNTADRFTVRCTFANGVEMLILDKLNGFGADNGILIEGDDGNCFVNRQKLTGPAVDALKDHPLPAGVLPPLRMDVGQKHERHIANFFDCCRDRTRPISDVFTHHRNLSTCHLANIALRLGRKIRWDASAQQIVDDEEANRFQARPQREGYELT